MNAIIDTIQVKCSVDSNDCMKIEYENDPYDGEFVSFMAKENGSVQSIIVANKENAIKIRDFLNEKFPQV